MDENEESEFLERLANRVWNARREGVVIGVAYTVFVGFFLYAAFSGNPLRFLAIVCYMMVITATLIIWLKVFQRI